VLLQRGGEREDVAHVVVDHEHLAAAQAPLVLDPLHPDLLLLGNAGESPVQEQGRLVEKLLGRPRILHDHGRGNLLQLALLVRAQVPPSIDHDRQVAAALGRADSLDQGRAVEVGQAEIDDDAVEAARLD
jgi:hypothetical protein